MEKLSVLFGIFAEDFMAIEVESRSVVRIVADGLHASAPEVGTLEGFEVLVLPAVLTMAVSTEADKAGK